MALEAISTTTMKPRLSGIIWGDAKSGKTTWAMSLPGRKLLINFDPDGFTSIAHRDDVSVIDLSQLAPQEQINQGKKVGQYILDNADNFESIVLDSLTTLVEAALYDAVARNIGGGKTFTATLDAPGLAAYGGRNNNVNDVCSRILRASAQKSKHCFFIAHLDDPEYDQDGKFIIQQTMMLSSKIRNTQSLKMSELYHLGVASGNRRIVYLAPFGNLRPMGSRIFDTVAVPKFELKYDIEKPDIEQNHSLLAIINRWQDGGLAKIKSIPSV